MTPEIATALTIGFILLCIIFSELIGMTMEFVLILLCFLAVVLSAGASWCIYKVWEAVL